MIARLRLGLAARTSAAILALSLGLVPPTALGQGAGRTAPPSAKPPATRKPPTGDPAVGKVQGAASPSRPPKAVEDPEAVAKMEDLLLRWEAKSKKVRSLSVKYTRVDVNKVFDSKKTYVGEAQLKSPDFVYLDFYEAQDGKAKGPFSERIVCDGKRLYHFVGLTKKIWIYPLDQNPKDRALNQGPLPFLFDMTVAKAKSRYHLHFVGEDQGAYYIQIIPKLPVDREEFTQALIKLDKARLQPQAIRLTLPGGDSDTKTFTFAPDALLENCDIKPAWFDGPAQVKQLPKADKWVAVVNPGPDGNPQNATPAPRNPAVGAKPSPKGAPIRQR